MLMTGIAIGVLVFGSKLFIYFMFIRKIFPRFCNWTETDMRYMVIWELFNIVSTQVGGAITGILAGAVATLLGVITSWTIVNTKKMAKSWQGSSFSQHLPVSSPAGRSRSW